MTKYSSRYASSPEAVKKYDTQELRNEFLIDDLMQEDEVVLVYSHYDRYITGSAVPVKKDLFFRLNQNASSMVHVQQSLQDFYNADKYRFLLYFESHFFVQ